MLLACMIEPDDLITTVDFIKSIFISNKWNINIIDTHSSNWIHYLTECAGTCTISIIKTSLQEINNIAKLNIKFDILIIDGETTPNLYDSFSLFKIILPLLKTNAYLIINSDNFDIFNYLYLKNYNVITYGFNNLANLSTSSIGDFFLDSSFMCSLTKTIHSYNGTTFEPQEYIFKLSYPPKNPYNILAAAMLAIISGIDLNSTI